MDKRSIQPAQEPSSASNAAHDGQPTKPDLESYDGDQPGKRPVNGIASGSECSPLGDPTTSKNIADGGRTYSATSSSSTTTNGGGHARSTAPVISKNINLDEHAHSMTPDTSKNTNDNVAINDHHDQPQLLLIDGEDKSWVDSLPRKLREVEHELGRASSQDREETSASMRDKLLSAYEEYGDQLYRRNDFDEALVQYCCAYEIVKEGRSNNDPRVVEARLKLAYDCMYLRKWGIAKDHFQEHLLALQKLQTDEDYTEKACESRYMQALCLYEMENGDLSAASDLLRENISDYKDMVSRPRSMEWHLMEWHAILIRSKDKLADVYLKDEKFQDARTHCEEVLEANLKASGQSETKDTVRCRFRLARNLYRLNEFERAKAHFLFNQQQVQLLDTDGLDLLKAWIEDCETLGNPTPLPTPLSTKTDPFSYAATPDDTAETISSGTLTRVSTFEEPFSPILSRNSTGFGQDSAVSREEPKHYGLLFENDDYNVDRWFIQLRRTHSLIFGGPGRRSKPSRQKVRIAILDTGIDGNLGLFQNCKKIMAWKDWTEKDKNEINLKEASRTLIQETCVDVDGHGTHLTGLLLEVNPMAHIYIARVATTRKQGVKPEDVAEAIKHASEEWKVDIISMSFGFQGQRTRKMRIMLENHVLDAYRKKCLMFAACTNDGSTEVSRAYPADDDHVICVGAAHSSGDPYARNPEPKSNARYHTTLGVLVPSVAPKSQWVSLEGDGNQRTKKTGCSVATAILAACGSLVLEFVRQEKEYAKQGYLEVMEAASESLMNPRYMKEVFNLMSARKGITKGYVVPWKLFDSNIGNPDPRQHICNQILGALERDNCDLYQ